MYLIVQRKLIAIFVIKKYKRSFTVTLSTIVYSALLVFASFVVGVVFISYVAYKSKNPD